MNNNRIVYLVPNNYKVKPKKIVVFYEDERSYYDTDNIIFLKTFYNAFDSIEEANKFYVKNIDELVDNYTKELELLKEHKTEFLESLGLIEEPKGMCGIESCSKCGCNTIYWDLENKTTPFCIKCVTDIF